ncbi:hypothetical protein SAMN05660226_03215 [Parapedobacter luteus]|uniref:Uncharacterized protein n=1 Tax=Parapedobacter luteus TaxID=623280 RepID=A0A1T5EAF1_9SPHI|nr:hypothetical protein SAMN05660226_03215 [Parapedobacter luteus]
MYVPLYPCSFISSLSTVVTHPHNFLSSPLFYAVAASICETSAEPAGSLPPPPRFYARCSQGLGDVSGACRIPSSASTVLCPLQPGPRRRQRSATDPVMAAMGIKTPLTTHHHSSRSESTGFATAARMACPLTVSRAKMMAANPAPANIHHWRSIW